MINKIVDSPEKALADVPDGATVMIGGFGNAGMPAVLIDTLIAQGARDLTIESPGPVGLRASGEGSACVENIEVHATLGAGVGVEDLTAFTMNDVTISGTIDASNALLIPPVVTGP